MAQDPDTLKAAADDALAAILKGKTASHAIGPDGTVSATFLDPEKLLRVSQALPSSDGESGPASSVAGVVA